MIHASLPHENGAATNGAVMNGATANGAAATVSGWLKQTVHQFFSAVNWDDQPPEIQVLRQATHQPQSHSLNLLLTVNQFFSTVNWEGGAIAQPIKPAADPLSTPDQTKGFTLDDFSGLF
ncbi:MAG: hypothetical protein MUF72_04050 [Elainella sp. Prado103]|jgi:hypothetical protein|nr:hypothetical protein [Elainella sp. Prado103]